MRRMRKECCMALFAIFAIIVIASIAFFFCKTSSGLSILDSLKSWNWELISSVVTAIATAAAAVFAFCAYLQSREMRKHSSFDAIFTQLLSNMQSFINNPSIQVTDTKEKDTLCDNEKYNSFLNFCLFYKKRTNDGKELLDENKIEQLWRSYTDNLVYQSNFLNCFKYFYHIVDTVIDSPLDENDKRKYIGIVQAQLNLDILFCYLVNLIAAYHGQEEKYSGVLKQYNFFKNLFDNHDGYGKLIERTIPNSLIEKYQIEKKMYYHIMIDRFYPTNAEYKEREFNGGNIKGIIEKLDYIQGLGMNGIMLTPFYQTNGYHGYHITDYDKVDPHFGNWDDVKALVQEVHKRNMEIVADFVPNHCFETNRLYTDRKHQNWFRYNWFRYKKKGKVRGFAKLNFLPMFNSDNIDVQQYFIERGLKLCDVGFDAIRLDHATGPTYNFWKAFYSAIKDKYKKVQIIGEVWGEMDFKSRNRLRYLWNKLRYSAQEARQMEYVGVLDGVLDFRYQELICNAVHDEGGLEKNKKLKRSIIKHFGNYPSGFQLWLFLDNHDMNRFLFECKGNQEKLQEAINYTKQWYRPFLMYYGTEKNMSNETDIREISYGDEQVRKPMIWD